MRAVRRIAILAATAAALAIPSSSLAQAGSQLGNERSDIAAIFTPDLTR
jgi:hypothetical protein